MRCNEEVEIVRDMLGEFLVCSILANAVAIALHCAMGNVNPMAAASGSVKTVVIAPVVKIIDTVTKLPDCPVCKGPDSRFAGGIRRMGAAIANEILVIAS